MSQTWTTLPGSYDAVHAADIYPSDNAYDIPALRHTPLAHYPKWLVPYRQRVRSNMPLDDGAVHFFLDDYRFESVWTHPKKALRALGPYRTVLSPGFSTYADDPLAVQLWNTYRNRWCGAYWQDQGKIVIPTIHWSTPESYEFCFTGVARHSIVAISPIGLAKSPPVAHEHFRLGFEEMLRRLTPSLVLCYGKLPDQTLHDLVPVISYPTRWDNVRAARARAQQ
ncbi:MAG: DUF4417 domain-containing protein [Anaerolineae bacterium]|nr:DUF4417 domain-containing protein [Anaerolineae bacterium]